MFLWMNEHKPIRARKIIGRIFSTNMKIHSFIVCYVVDNFLWMITHLAKFNQPIFVRLLYLRLCILFRSDMPLGALTMTYCELIRELKPKPFVLKSWSDVKQKNCFTHRSLNCKECWTDSPFCDNCCQAFKRERQRAIYVKASKSSLEKRPTIRMSRLVHPDWHVWP